MAAKPGAERPPLLGELMPWAVSAPRPGRGWVAAPDAEVLRRRWARLAAADPEERRRLFTPTRARTADSPAAQLPGRDTPTAPVAREPGPCPAAVRVCGDGFDRTWLLADQRLLDVPRPELWRVADDRRQIFLTVSTRGPSGPSLRASAELPVAVDPHGRTPGLVRPLYRRPDGEEPNLAPGLTELIATRLTGGGPAVPALDVAAWVAALTLGAGPGASGDGSGDPPVPLTASPELWERGVALGRRMLWLHTFGTRCAAPDEDRPAGPPRLPGGRRPYVRQAVRGMPDSVGYDPEGEALLLGTEGRISPVPAAAWDLRAGDGERLLEAWFAARAATGSRTDAPSTASVPRQRAARTTRAGRSGAAQPELIELTATEPDSAPSPPDPVLHSGTTPAPEPVPDPGTTPAPEPVPHPGTTPPPEPVPNSATAPPPPGLSALVPARPRTWPREWTSELTELVSVLVLLAELVPEARALAELVAAAPQITAGELSAAGVLPPPQWARRPASVLGTREEGPEGQFALL